MDSSQHLVAVEVVRRRLVAQLFHGRIHLATELEVLASYTQIIHACFVLGRRYQAFGQVVFEQSFFSIEVGITRFIDQAGNLLLGTNRSTNQLAMYCNTTRTSPRKNANTKAPD